MSGWGMAQGLLQTKMDAVFAFKILKRETKKNESKSFDDFNTLFLAFNPVSISEGFKSRVAIHQTLNGGVGVTEMGIGGNDLKLEMEYYMYSTFPIPSYLGLEKLGEEGNGFGGNATRVGKNLGSKALNWAKGAAGGVLGSLSPFSRTGFEEMNQLLETLYFCHARKDGTMIDFFENKSYNPTEFNYHKYQLIFYDIERVRKLEVAITPDGLNLSRSISDRDTFKLSISMTVVDDLLKKKKPVSNNVNSIPNPSEMVNSLFKSVRQIMALQNVFTDLKASFRAGGALLFQNLKSIKDYQKDLNYQKDQMEKSSKKEYSNAYDSYKNPKGKTLEQKSNFYLEFLAKEESRVKRIGETSEANILGSVNSADWIALQQKLNVILAPNTTSNTPNSSGTTTPPGTTTPNSPITAIQRYNLYKSIAVKSVTIQLFDTNGNPRKDEFGNLMYEKILVPALPMPEVSGWSLVSSDISIDENNKKIEFTKKKRVFSDNNGLTTFTLVDDILDIESIFKIGDIIQYFTLSNTGEEVSSTKKQFQVASVKKYNKPQSGTAEREYITFTAIASIQSQDNSNIPSQTPTPSIPPLSENSISSETAEVMIEYYSNENLKIIENYIENSPYVKEQPNIPEYKRLEFMLGKELNYSMSIMKISVDMLAYLKWMNNDDSFSVYQPVGTENFKDIAKKYMGDESYSTKLALYNRTTERKDMPSVLRIPDSRPTNIINNLSRLKKITHKNLEEALFGNDLKLDSSGDFSIKNGDFDIITGSASVTASLTDVLSNPSGSWVADLSLGNPLPVGIPSVNINPVNKIDYITEIGETILKDPRILDVQYISMEQDADIMKYEFKVKTKANEIFSIEVV
jgi:hypothetical protein